MTNHVAVLREIRARYTTSGSPARCAALDAAIEALSAQQSEAVAKLINLVDTDGGRTTRFIRPTSLGIDLPLGEYPLYLSPSPTPAMRAVVEALQMAMSWNWLDDDARPSKVADQCDAALAEVAKMLGDSK